MGALLFVPAGTLAWPGAWAFLAVTWVLGLAVGTWLLRYDPALLKERMGSFVQRGQAATDKLLVVTIMAICCAWFVLMGLDARYGWSSAALWVQALGAVGVFLSVYLGYLTFRANSFASPVVKIQTERAHSVVTSGP